MSSLFFTGLLGFVVWMLGLIEWRLLNNRVVPHEYMAINSDNEKAPLFDANGMSMRTY